MYSRYYDLSRGSVKEVSDDLITRGMQSLKLKQGCNLTNSLLLNFKLAAVLLNSDDLVVWSNYGRKWKLYLDNIIFFSSQFFHGQSIQVLPC
jgi:hypothetical protein